MRDLLTGWRWIFSRFLPVLLVFLVIFFLLRGPYLSNSIKRVIIPVLENATGERIITDHAVINLFPFYIQIKSIRVFNDEGQRLIWITKTRAYIDLLALLRGEIRLLKLSLKEPDITASREDLQRMVRHIKDYLSSGKGKGIAFTLKGIRIKDGAFDLGGTGRLKRLSGREVAISGLLRGDDIILDWSIDEGLLLIKGLSEIVYSANGRTRIGGNGEVEFSDIDMTLYGSELKAEGKVFLSADGGFKKGVIRGDARVLVENINRVLGMGSEEAKEGEIRLAGGVDILSDRRGPDFVFDLKTRGSFYLEDLMRFLGVKERIKGRISLDGRIRGSYRDLMGEGRVELKDGLLSTLPLEDARGRILYRNKRFDLKGFIAHTYNGELKGDAYLLLPHGDYFVRANIKDINSKDFFKFIRWNAPFREGTINGEFSLKKIKGKDMDVVANLKYINENISEDGAISRLRLIKGRFHLKDKIVNISDTRFYSSASEMSMSGRIDPVRKHLILDINLSSNDASELLKDFKGDLSLIGSVKGAFNRIVLSGFLRMSSGSIGDFVFDRLDSNIEYTMDSLKLKRLNINKGISNYDIEGDIFFKDATQLFSFNTPMYDVKVSMKNGDVKLLMRSILKKGGVNVSGNVDGTLLFNGTKDRYKGNAKLHIKNAGIWGEAFDSVDLEASFSDRIVDVHSLKLKTEASELLGKGILSHDNNFKFSFTSDRLILEDIKIFNRYNIKAKASDFRLDASGTFENPVVYFFMNLQDVYFKKLTLRNGMIRGRIRGRKLYLTASLLNNGINVDGTVAIENEPEWNLSVHFRKGNYKTLLNGIIEDLPEDAFLKLKGDVEMRGRGKEVLSMASRFDTINLGLYGYKFANKEEVSIRLDDKRLEIKSFELTGDNANISISGRVNINNDYDIKMKGYLRLSPLKVLASRISSLRGGGDFTVGVSGRWRSPVIMGEIDFRGVTTSIKDFPYIIGPFDGSISIKEDRMVIKSLVGKIAGGGIEMSGTGYLEGFSLKRLSITSRFNNIRISHLEGIRAVFDGQLFYDVSKEGSVLTGDLYITRARYKKDVKWKRWLAGLKETNRETPQWPAFLKDTALNIHITGSKDIVIDNNILRTPVRVDLTVTGSLNRYGLIGSIRTDEGSIYFRGNEFEIISARIDFIEADEVRPLFDIKAEGFSSGYKVKLNLLGSVDKLDLSLFSDPPLSEGDILTLLTTGRIEKEVKGFESGIAAAEATAILTGGIQDVFEESVKDIIGVERFEINPQTLSTGAISPRITVGKRLLDKRLSVSYTTSIGTTEESIIRLKYDMGKKISIIGTRNELGSIGIDLNYRFEFE